jgi:hypothetical protein
MFNAKKKKENRNAILFLDNVTCHPKVHLAPSKCNKCITAHGYGCYLHIQIALQMIFDAMFDFECRMDAANWIRL